MPDKYLPLRRVGDPVPLQHLVEVCRLGWRLAGLNARERGGGDPKLAGHLLTVLRTQLGKGRETRLDVAFVSLSEVVLKGRIADKNARILRFARSAKETQ